MLRVARFACCVVLLVLLSAGGCDEDPARPRSSGSPASSSPPTPTTSGASVTPTTEATTPASTATPTSTDRLSGIATRTGFTITHEGQPIDAAGLLAIGWTIDAATGSAHWTDPDLGDISVTWEIPDERAIAFFDVSFWGEVTAQNTAMNPSMATAVFTAPPREVTAHSTGGTKAETPTGLLRVTVPEQPVGTMASVSINLGFPRPVLITYTYVYV